MDLLADALSRAHATPGPHAFEFATPDGFALEGRYEFGPSAFEIEILGPAQLGGSFYSAAVVRSVPRGRRAFLDVFDAPVLYPHGEFRILFDPETRPELVRVAR